MATSAGETNELTAERIQVTTENVIFLDADQPYVPVEPLVSDDDSAQAPEDES